MDNGQLSRLILNRSENEVDDMIEEPEKEKTQTTKTVTIYLLHSEVYRGVIFRIIN